MNDISAISHDIAWIIIAFCAGWWAIGWLYNFRGLLMWKADDEVIVFQEMAANGLQNGSYLECIQFSDMISGERSFDVHTKRLTAHLKSATLTQSHPVSESNHLTPIPTIDQRNAFQLSLNIVCASACIVEVLVGVPRTELKRLRDRQSHNATHSSNLGERRVSPSAQSEASRIVGRLNRLYSIKQEVSANAALRSSETTTNAESSSDKPVSTNTSQTVNISLPMSSVSACTRDRSLMPITIQISNVQSSRIVGGGELQELVWFKFAQSNEETNNRQTDHVELQLQAALTFDARLNAFVEMDDVFGINPNDQSDCVICLSESKRVMIGPCRHVCVCVECYRSFTAQKCPICRTAVKWTMEFT